MQLGKQGLRTLDCLVGLRRFVSREEHRTGLNSGREHKKELAKSAAAVTGLDVEEMNDGSFRRLMEVVTNEPNDVVRGMREAELSAQGPCGTQNGDAVLGHKALDSSAHADLEKFGVVAAPSREGMLIGGPCVDDEIVVVHGCRRESKVVAGG